MGAEAQVANDALVVAALSPFPNGAVHHLVEIGVLVDAVDEAEVGVVGAEQGQARLELSDGLLRVGGPTVFAAGVVGADMHLQHGAVALALERPGIAFESDDFARHEVEVVDAGVQGGAHDALRLGSACVMDRAHPESDDADLVATMWQGAVFHFLDLR